MQKYVATILFAGAMIAAHPAWAEDKIVDVTDMHVLRAAVRSDKKALVASTLKLTDVESKRFWPLYDAYQSDLDLYNRRRTVALEGLLANDKPLSDLYARNLANELIATDQGEIKARRTFHNRLMRGVPTRTFRRRKQRATCSSNRKSAPFRRMTSLRPFP